LFFLVLPPPSSLFLLTVGQLHLLRLFCMSSFQAELAKRQLPARSKQAASHPRFPQRGSSLLPLQGEATSTGARAFAFLIIIFPLEAFLTLCCSECLKLSLPTWTRGELYSDVTYCGVLSTFGPFLVGNVGWFS
jgi:hypothetical protein